MNFRMLLDVALAVRTRATNIVQARSGWGAAHDVEQLDVNAIVSEVLTQPMLLQQPGTDSMRDLMRECVLAGIAEGGNREAYIGRRPPYESKTPDAIVDHVLDYANLRAKQRSA